VRPVALPPTQPRRHAATRRGRDAPRETRARGATGRAGAASRPGSTVPGVRAAPRTPAPARRFGLGPGRTRAASREHPDDAAPRSPNRRPRSPRRARRSRRATSPSWRSSTLGC